MYEIDFVSAVIGYILGVILYNSLGNLLFVETNNEDK
jgi:hypothetical protein